MLKSGRMRTEMCSNFAARPRSALRDALQHIGFDALGELARDHVLVTPENRCLEHMPVGQPQQQGLRKLAAGKPGEPEAILRGVLGMVRPTGFEPVAPRLGIWCSILLSYGRRAFL